MLCTCITAEAHPLSQQPGLLLVANAAITVTSRKINAESPTGPQGFTEAQGMHGKATPDRHWQAKMSGDISVGRHGVQLYLGAPMLKLAYTIDPVAREK